MSNATDDKQTGPTLAGEDISNDPLTRMNQIRDVMGLDALPAATELKALRHALMRIATCTGTPEQRAAECQRIAREMVDWMPF